MDEQWREALEQFDRVWPRVRPDGPPPPPPDGRPGRPPVPRPPAPPRPAPPPKPPELRELEELIRRESEAGKRYLALAERTQGRSRAELRRLAAGSGRLLKQLQQEYFMRTGDTLPAPRFRPERRPVPEELRQLWREAEAAEQRYLFAAAGGDPSLRRLYGEAAELKRRQAQMLRELTGRLFR